MRRITEFCEEHGRLIHFTWPLLSSPGWTLGREPLNLSKLNRLTVTVGSQWRGNTVTRHSDLPDFK